MLKPLSCKGLVGEEYRRRYADASSSLTLWFGEEGKILAIELIFDLLLDEFALRWVRGTKPRYAKLDTEEVRPGRHGKQVMGTEDLAMPVSRVEDFEKRSANIPPPWRNFIRDKLQEMIGESS